MRVFIGLVCSLFIVYALSSYGGTRSPDEELQFRSAEGLAFSGLAAVEQDLDTWPGFGVATGLDGKRYPVFGPMEPLVLSAWLRLSEPLAQELASSSSLTVPRSYYQREGDLSHEQLHERRISESRRFLGSFFQSAVAALTVGIFYLFALRLSLSVRGALFSALAFGLATPFWAYSGMYFGEVYALALICFALLMHVSEFHLIAGLSLGLAAAAHVSALLWVPFFLLIPSWDRGAFVTLRRSEIVLFLMGLLIALLPLGYLQYIRFGDFFETGRYLGSPEAQRFGYGEFTLPERGLLGLLIGAGKGLFLYAPVTLLALFCWRPFHHAFPRLAKVLLAAALFRIAFMAARTDWHGGFCLGPRYLLLALPALLVALAFWVRDSRLKTGFATALLALFIVEQAFLTNVEVFSMYHELVTTADKAGIDVFSSDALYLHWENSPFVAGWEFEPGSWMARAMGETVSAATVFFGCLGTAIAALWLSQSKISGKADS